jgi:hypothetical protein
MASLAASHTLIKPSIRLCVYHPYVPFMFGASSEYSDAEGCSTAMLCVPRNADTFETKGTLWGNIGS